MKALKKRSLLFLIFVGLSTVGFNVIGGGWRNRFESSTFERSEDQARKAAVAAAFVAGATAMAAAQQEGAQPDQQESQGADEGRSVEEVFDSIKKLPPIAFIFGCLIVVGLFKKIFG